MSSSNPIIPDVLAEKLWDATVPGFQAECSPDEAEEMGAFEETALTEDEAMEASIEGAADLV